MVRSHRIRIPDLAEARLGCFHTSRAMVCDIPKTNLFLDLPYFFAAADGRADTFGIFTSVM